MKDQLTLEQLEEEGGDKGIFLTGSIGGVVKTRYWTPDGRQILAVPSIRTYVRRNAKGKIIESGTRDANLDRGWLLAPPTELKPYCPGCDNWHDTQDEVDACVAEKKRKEALWNSKVKRQKTNGDGENEVAALKAEMTEIKSLLEQLLKGDANG